MLFDFTILLICFIGLLKHKRKAGAGAGQGQFWQLLRRQGPPALRATLAVPLTTQNRNLILLYLVHCQSLPFHIHRPQFESCVHIIPILFLPTSYPQL